MSKKIAEGINALVLDVKTGVGAFMTEYEQSVQLAKTLIRIGEDAGITTIAYITDMNNPLGNTVGNWLEIVECIECLQGDGPADLIKITHQLAGAMIYLGGKADSIDNGIEISKDLIRSGAAWSKLIEIVEEQEGDTEIIERPHQYPKSKYQAEYIAPENGWIEIIDAYEIGMAALQLGAGRQKSEDNIDYKAGIRFYHKVGEKIEKGSPILTLYTDKKEMIDNVLERINRAIKISSESTTPSKLIIGCIDKNDLERSKKINSVIPH